MVPECSNDGMALERLVIDFTEAFSRKDIDEVISSFAEGAIYDEFNEIRHVGKAAIRWLLTIEEGSRAGGWHGLGVDLLHFEGDRLTERHTYTKSKSPKLAKNQDSESVRLAIDEDVLQAL